MTATDTTLVAVHLAATAGMMGLIWFVQLVHYPLFDAVDAEQFTAFESAHQRWTAWVVGPLMGVEGMTALAIAVVLRDEVGLILAIVGLALLAGIHVSTVMLQVPAHGRLAQGFDAVVHRRLVRTNWIRTVGWSLRVVVASAMIVVAN